MIFPSLLTKFKSPYNSLDLLQFFNVTGIEKNSIGQESLESRIFLAELQINQRHAGQTIYLSHQQINNLSNMKWKRNSKIHASVWFLDKSYA